MGGSFLIGRGPEGAAGMHARGAVGDVGHIGGRVGGMARVVREGGVRQLPGHGGGLLGELCAAGVGVRREGGGGGREGRAPGYKRTVVRRRKRKSTRHQGVGCRAW